MVNKFADTHIEFVKKPMKNNIRYILYMILICAVLPLQDMFIQQEKARASREFDIIHYALIGNLCMLGFGLFLAFEIYIAEKVNTKIRLVIRLAVSAILMVEIFKYPLLSRYSLMNQWSVVLPAAAITSGFLLINGIMDIFRQKKHGTDTDE